MFPKNITVEDCRRAMVERFEERARGNRPGQEFREKTDATHIFFNYDYSFPGECCTFPDPDLAPDPDTRRLWLIRREMRGLIFSRVTGRCVARRFHKFFNVNETPETNAARIDISAPFELVEKLDGSLASPYLDDDNVTIRWGTKMGETDPDLRAFVQSHPENRFEELSQHWMQQGYTPLFEWCNSMREVVLHYGKDMLVLTALRRIDDGEYLASAAMRAAAAEFNVPVARDWRLAPEAPDFSLGLEKALESVKGLPGIEGCVMRFDDGRMYKLKTEWYFERSKKKQMSADAFNLNVDREVWAMILSNELDDHLVQISVSRRDGFCRAAADLWARTEELFGAVMHVANQLLAEAYGKAHPELAAEIAAGRAEAKAADAADQHRAYPFVEYRRGCLPELTEDKALRKEFNSVLRSHLPADLNPVLKFFFDVFAKPGNPKDLLVNVLIDKCRSRKSFEEVQLMESYKTMDYQKLMFGIPHDPLGEQTGPA